MFNSTVLWVGLGFLLLVVVILYNTPRTKATRARRVEECRRQEEERGQKEKEEAARKAKQLENFRKQRLVMYIREKDGRNSSFETVLIRTLLQMGVAVQLLHESDGRAIANGDTESLKDGSLAIVGTSESKEKTGGGYEDHFTGGWINNYRYEVTYCDYRLLATDDDGAVRILGAGYKDLDSSRAEWLANLIIKDLASMVPAPSPPEAE